MIDEHIGRLGADMTRHVDGSSYDQLAPGVYLRRGEPGSLLEFTVDADTVADRLIRAYGARAAAARMTWIAKHVDRGAAATLQRRAAELGVQTRTVGTAGAVTGSGTPAVPTARVPESPARRVHRVDRRW